MIKRILVALSGTPFTPSAVRHAVEIARATGAEVTGVTAVDTRRLQDVGPVPIGGGAAAHALAAHRVRVTEERVEEQVAAFRLACGETDVTCRVVRETGDSFEEFKACWRYHDLTVLGLRGLFEYGVVHNPEDEVVRLIASGVRPILAVSEEYRQVNRALIAYNGSMESAMALKRFVQARLWPDATLEIACFDMDDAKASELLADAAGYCRAHGFDPLTSKLPEDPCEGVLAHATKTGASIIVMGATGHGRLRKLLLGDTVAHAIRNAEVPLYLTR